MIDKHLKEARKIQDDIWAFGEKVNKIMTETSEGYAKQVFKVALLDIMVNTLIQRFRDINLQEYEKVKDLVLSMLEETGSKVHWVQDKEEK